MLGCRIGFLQCLVSEVNVVQCTVAPKSLPILVCFDGCVGLLGSPGAWVGLYGAGFMVLRSRLLT